MLQISNISFKFDLPLILFSFANIHVLQTGWAWQLTFNNSPNIHGKPKPSSYLVLRRGNQFAIPLTESLPKISYC